jgi:hypothetical protein
MPLAHNETQLIKHWLTNRMKDTCPVCGGHSFKYGDRIEFRDALIPGVPSCTTGTLPQYLFVPIVCSGCAYTMLLSLNHLASLSQTP